MKIKSISIIFELEKISCSHLKSCNTTSEFTLGKVKLFIVSRKHNLTNVSVVLENFTVLRVL